jgi:hypothetical protein
LFISAIAMKKLLLLIICFGVLYACSTDNSKNASDKNANPSADGFNLSGSDAKAIEIADKVMIAMGGRKSWDESRFFTWNFFGRRSLWWDKFTGDVRIKFHDADSLIILVNINDNSGKISKNGAEMVHPDSVSQYLDRGKGVWINDAYWLFMPFKLKDSGVTLTYVGEDTTQTGAVADVLQLTFKDVGNTPQNKYHVWVDRSDNLVKQWAFYRENDMDTPNFITPWVGYQKCGKVLLAGDRGERQITDIAAPENLDKSFFKEF